METKEIAVTTVAIPMIDIARTAEGNCIGCYVTPLIRFPFFIKFFIFAGLVTVNQIAISVVLVPGRMIVTDIITDTDRGRAITIEVGVVKTPLNGTLDVPANAKKESGDRQQQR